MKKDNLFKYVNDKVDTEIEDFINNLIMQKQRQMASVRSRTKGELGELMTTMMFTKSRRSKVIVDKQHFKTPYGKRRIDNYLHETKQAIESKNTYVTARKFIINQINKDEYLLKNGIVSEILWVCFEGASKNVIEILEEKGIYFISLRENINEAIIKNNDNEVNFQTIIEC